MLKKIRNLFSSVTNLLITSYHFIASLIPWFLYVVQRSVFILAFYFTFTFSFIPALLCLGLSMLLTLRIENMIILSKIREHETILQGVDECFDYQSTIDDSQESK